MTPEKKARLIAGPAAWLMRALFSTLRFRFTDHARVLATPPERPLLWAFWHNRLFVMPWVFERYFPGRPGAALMSQSKDGAIISAIVEKFGIRAIRGSSSRGGARALVAMRRAIAEGCVVAITPDGPRGPRYTVNPGVVKLAQLTGGTILPVRVEYSRCWRLGSWDGFMIPQPFATVHITFDPLHHVAQSADDPAFEEEVARLATRLGGEA